MSVRQVLDVDRYEDTLVLFFITTRSVGTLREEVYIVMRRIDSSRLVGWAGRFIKIGDLASTFSLTVNYGRSSISLIRRLLSDLYVTKCRISILDMYLVATCGSTRLVLLDVYRCGSAVQVTYMGKLSLSESCREVYRVDLDHPMWKAESKREREH